MAAELFQWQVVRRPSVNFSLKSLISQKRSYDLFANFTEPLWHEVYLRKHFGPPRIDRRAAQVPPEWPRGCFLTFCPNFSKTIQ